MARTSIAIGILALTVRVGATQQISNPAPAVTTLAGSRDRPGLFAQRVTFPPGSCSPYHVHNTELHGLVTRGRLRLGVADSRGAIVVREYPAGSFIPIPSERVHVEGAGAEEGEVYVTGVGPVQTTVREGGSKGGCKVAAPVGRGSETDSVAALVTAYDRAWKGRDTIAVNRLLAPDYQYFTSRGGVESKADAMAVVASPEYILQRADRSEISVRNSGIAATVSSRWKGAGTYKGETFTDDQRCGQVWVRAGTSWQLLSEHCVQIAAP